MEEAINIFCYPRLAIPFLAWIISLFALSLPTLADDSGTNSLLDLDKSRQLLESDPDAWLKVVQTVESSSNTVASASSTSHSGDAGAQLGNSTTGGGGSASAGGGHEQPTPAANGPTLEETEKYIVDRVPTRMDLTVGTRTGFIHSEKCAQKITFNQDGSFDYADKTSMQTSQDDGYNLDNSASYDLIKVTVPFNDIDTSSLTVVSNSYAMGNYDNPNTRTVYLVSMKFINAVSIKSFSDSAQAAYSKRNKVARDNDNTSEFYSDNSLTVDSGNEKDDSVTHLEIVINDKDTAERVLKAFKHAIDLLGGGHKDPFAP